MLRNRYGIPLRPSGKSDERFFPLAESEAPWDVDVLRPSNNARRVIEDMHTGAITVKILDDFGKNKDKDHGLISGGIAREWWTIHPDDPLSAHGKTHWTMETGRNGWTTRTESFAEMRSDRANFYLTARLEAYENDTLIFEKNLSDAISRHSL